MAHAVEIYHYPDLVEYAFGLNARYVLNLCVAVLHFSFCFAMLSFFTKTLKNLTKAISGEDVDIWWFMLITIIVLAPVVWIRTLERFRYGFIYSCVVIIAIVGIILYFDTMKI